MKYVLQMQMTLHILPQVPLANNRRKSHC